MEDLPDVPWMDYEEIRKKADSFLEKYHPSRSIPVPIDDIAERKLNLDIIPLPGLYNVLDMDGFLYGDFSSIAVDKGVMEHVNPARYRFTIAHEVGHLALHPQLFKVSKVQDVDGWKTFVKAIPDSLLRRVEWQGRCFAGLLLVPQAPLKVEIQKAIKDIKGTMDGISNNIKAHANSGFLRDIVEEWVAKSFEVSSQVISKRIEFDKLDKLVSEI